MASKKRRKSIVRDKMPLEWAYKSLVAVNAATNYSASIDLDLLQDEVAEIWKIDSTLEIDRQMPNVDEMEQVMGILSMNPDISTDLTPIQSVDDLETMFHHRFSVREEAAGAVANLAVIKATDEKKYDSDQHPILVGTNIGMLLRYTSTTADNVTWLVRVYFTRRKATVTELNQILLKRR